MLKVAPVGIENAFLASGQLIVVSRSDQITVAEKTKPLNSIMNIKKLSVIIASFVSVVSANALTLNPITSADFWAGQGSEVFALRAKDFANGESGGDIYLGKGDLGIGTNRVETTHTWQSGQIVNAFSLTYNSLTGLVTAVVGGTVLLDVFEAGKSIDKLTLQVRDNDQQFNWGLASVLINGDLAVPGVIPVPDGTVYVEIGDLPVLPNGDLQITGSLLIEPGYSASNENSKIELRAFAAPATAGVPDSGTTALLLGLGVLGLVGARKRFAW